MDTTILIIIVSLVASAFFSGMEIAFLTSNKLQIELHSKQGILSAKIFSYFIKRQPAYISSMLVGNNIAHVVFGIFMAEALLPFITPYTSHEVAILVIQTAISTIIILFASEFTPKNLFRINPNGVLRLMAFPVFIVYWILFPLVSIFTCIADFLMKNILRIRFPEIPLSFGRVDLDNYVRESLEKISPKEQVEHEVKIFHRALDFSSVKSRECMIPRTEIVAIEVNEPVDELKRMFSETRLSKILIYRGSMDNIIGYVHSHELFRKPENILSILLPVIVIPEAMPANEVLTLFIQQRRSIAIVVDEFGGTAGMLTMEDVMEEIFGEIEDEHDREELIEKRISETEFIFSGRLEIDYLNERYQLGLPRSNEYETLAGLIINLHQSIPQPNTSLRVENYVLTVISAGETRIEQVRVKTAEE
jgi:CBS domain containing-hemolysin-like protein